MTRPFSLILLAATVSVSAYAQKFGAAENLGPNIPTPQLVVDRMLEAAHVKPGEMVYDLGSGDGRIVITAAQKFGARAVGVEIDPIQCRYATEKIKAMGLSDRVSIVEGSALRVDLSPANVVTMFFLTASNERLKPALEKHLKRGSRVVPTSSRSKAGSPWK